MMRNLTLADLKFCFSGDARNLGISSQENVKLLLFQFILNPSIEKSIPMLIAEGFHLARQFDKINLEPKEFKKRGPKALMEPNIMMQRTVGACPFSCGNGPQQKGQKRPNSLTEKRSAAADHGVRQIEKQRWEPKANYL